MTPNSAASPAPGGDEASSPPPGALLSPKSTNSGEDSTHCNQPLEKDQISPRCHSHESAESSIPPRCLSDESLYSERPDLRGISLPATALSPIGVALPPTLPVAAAAALLPPQSAAMAAYLNAAAAAAQHSHRLMMTSPLPSYNRVSASPLISSSSPPDGLNVSSSSPTPDSLPPPGILDFSKRSLKHDPDEADVNIMNLSKADSLSSSEPHFNSPLDLSVTNRKRGSEDMDSHPSPRKQRTDYKSPLLAQWASPIAAPHLPYFAAAVAAANLSPKTNAVNDAWNGKLKYGTATPSDATKALEKMSELSKLGGEDLFRSIANTGASVNSSNSRHSAWQSHWLNKGAEQAKDVLKCVWCKQSFPSLAAMTTHMKEAKHCGVNVPVSVQSQNLPPQPPISSPSSNASSGVSSTSSSNKPNQSDLNLLIKETMPLPRKLVRGQDVWLGKGAEQTRQILKCMWCGQSFRSLAEMTSHMQQTQHYTNIISQEQIISWKSSDDMKGGGGGGAGGASSGSAGSANSHVSAVLTCKVCDQAFSSLKELSNHMVKNSHYKEHIMRSITDGGRRRQTREKRKKSLPVRKLLELERAQHEFKNGDTASIIGKTAGVGRITCEKCGDKIDTSLFVDHIRQCVGGGALGSSQRNFLKSALLSNSILPPESLLDSGQNPSRENGKNNESPSTPIHQSPTDLATGKRSSTPENNNGSSPSVLNAIEKLIEKSFDSRTRQNSGFAAHGPSAAPMGSSILKRLGIDESVDYTKPLVDAQTMNLLRSYHQQQSHHYSKRERSGSESSSVSERGSRVDALTPERKIDSALHHPITSTPRSTPDKRDKSPCSEKAAYENKSDGELSVKKEIEDGDPSEVGQGVCLKREVPDSSEDFDRSNFRSSKRLLEMKEDPDAEKTKGSDGMKSSPVDSPHRQSLAADPGNVNSPCRNSTCSPASSDRSTTPRSTNGDKKGNNSLGALSSMFDNLSGASTSADSANTSGKRTSSHPLAALQKLCDKTETHHTNRSNASASAPPNMAVPSSHNVTQSGGPTPGAILAFSWACNDAVMTSDSIMKCAFCDTPFISKGAYRHHLSKMHFVKDGVIPDPVALKSPQPSSSSGPVNLKSGNGSGSSTSAALAPTGSKSPPITGNFEESPHSKFLKYTELAKQLSSKYV
ncbi:hypothetical protein PPYR_11389 [Photinus pyralis]|uniref:C2H2-type domain-containing protein n=2 Tax=Photinus pyralis TaxID=7054 RepID=A0A5N4AB43_PHOPY|nr:protein tiptop [Photinus pyralis]KAB0794550.1 hypothetical protein PPYR_11389 [Photinus pyralis]